MHAAVVDYPFLQYSRGYPVCLDCRRNIERGVPTAKIRRKLLYFLRIVRKTENTYRYIKFVSWSDFLSSSVFSPLSSCSLLLAKLIRPFGSRLSERFFRISPLFLRSYALVYFFPRKAYLLYRLFVFIGGMFRKSFGISFITGYNLIKIFFYRRLLVVE